MHTCPAPGCYARVDDDLLACRRHWRQIPKPLRDALQAAWADGEGMGSERHTEAVRACTEWLQGRD